MTKLNAKPPIELLSNDQNSDIYIFSGELTRDNANKLIQLCKQNKKKENVSLVVCTYGGDGDAAYIIAKYLKNHYSFFRLYVFGFCKSAGTLLAIGADEIIMSKTGELGPLDVQVIKEDVISPRGSGLDLINAITALRDYAFDYFETHLLELKKRSGLTISTKIASDISCKLTIGLLSPIMEQIDPIKLGETQRMTNIAYEYGKRLNSNDYIVTRLIYGYPSHSFVINIDEAQEIGLNVRVSDIKEEEVEKEISKLCEEKFGDNAIHEPLESIIIKLPIQEKRDDCDEQINSDNKNEINTTDKSENGDH